MYTQDSFENQSRSNFIHILRKGDPQMIFVNLLEAAQYLTQPLRHLTIKTAQLENLSSHLFSRTVPRSYERRQAMTVTERQSKLDISILEVLRTLSNLQPLSIEIYDCESSQWTTTSWLPDELARPRLEHLELGFSNAGSHHPRHGIFTPCHPHQAQSRSLNLLAVGRSKLKTIYLKNIAWNAGDIGRPITNNRETIESITLADWSCQPTFPSRKAIESMPATAGPDLLARVTFEQSLNMCESFCSTLWSHLADHRAHMPACQYWKVTAARLYNNDVARHLARRQTLKSMAFSVPVLVSQVIADEELSDRPIARIMECHVKQYELALLIKERKQDAIVLHDQLTQLRGQFPEYAAPEDWLDLYSIYVTAAQLDELIEWDLLKDESPSQHV